MKLLDGADCANKRCEMECPLKDWNVGDSTDGFCETCLKNTKKAEAIKRHVEKHGINPIGGGV